MSTPGTGSPAGMPSLLVAEAARRSRVCWLSYDHPGGSVRERLVWHAWYDDGAAPAVVVLSDAEQALPGIGLSDRVEVAMRAKDSRSLLVTWAARPVAVDPTDDSWEAHARALLGVRLNLMDPEAALRRWRTDASVVRLTPA